VVLGALAAYLDETLERVRGGQQVETVVILAELQQDSASGKGLLEVVLVLI
jgi:hypothetical protein